MSFKCVAKKPSLKNCLNKFVAGCNTRSLCCFFIFPFYFFFCYCFIILSYEFLFLLWFSHLFFFFLPSYFLFFYGLVIFLFNFTRPGHKSCSHPWDPLTCFCFCDCGCGRSESSKRYFPSTNQNIQNYCRK